MPESELLQVQPVIRVQVIDLHEADVIHRLHFALRPLEGRIVDLHIAHLGDLLRAFRRRDDGVCLLVREAQWLLDEDVLAGLQRRHRDLRLWIRMAQQDRLDIGCQQGVGVGKGRATWNAAAYAASPGDRSHTAVTANSSRSRPGSAGAAPARSRRSR